MAASCGGGTCTCAVDFSPENISEWLAGYEYGYDDNSCPWYGSPAFYRGFLVGKAEIDGLIDEAWEWNHSYHNGEY